MKKIIALLLLTLSLNTSANIFGYPNSLPDFDEIDEMSRAFSEDVKTIQQDVKVLGLVRFIEDTYNTSCKETDKTFRGVLSYFVTYECDNDTKLKIKARVKRDAVKLLGYKIK